MNQQRTRSTIRRLDVATLLLLAGTLILPQIVAPASARSDEDDVNKINRHLREGKCHDIWKMFWFRQGNEASQSMADLFALSIFILNPPGLNQVGTEIQSQKDFIYYHNRYLFVYGIVGDSRIRFPTRSFHKLAVENLQQYLGLDDVKLVEKMQICYADSKLRDRCVRLARQVGLVSELKAYRDTVMRSMAAGDIATCKRIEGM